MRHERYELAQMQSLPLHAKVSMTKRRIRDWYDGWEGQVYLSFSGGKDSTVLKNIIEDMNLDIPSVFVDTGLEYPEIRQFAKSQSNVTVLRPKMSFRDVILKYGYPIVGKEVAKDVEYARKGKEGMVHYDKLFGLGRYENSMYSSERWKFLFDAPFKVSASCCAAIKKHPMKQYQRETGRKTIVAMMASEGLRRKTSWEKYGCNGFDMTHPRSMPMAFWTEQDVLHYIAANHLPICSVYGEIKHVQKNQLPGQIDLIDSIGYEEGDKLYCTGCDRTGCIFCAFGAHLDKEPTRFQRLKQTHPKHWEYCIKGGGWKDGMWQPSEDGLGMGYVLDYIGVKYE